MSFLHFSRSAILIREKMKSVYRQCHVDLFIVDETTSQESERPSANVCVFVCYSHYALLVIVANAF